MNNYSCLSACGTRIIKNFQKIFDFLLCLRYNNPKITVCIKRITTEEIYCGN